MDLSSPSRINTEWDQGHAWHDVWEGCRGGHTRHDAMGGVFAQRGHSARTAPIIPLLIPGTPLKTTHLQKSIQKSTGSAEFRTLGHAESIRLKQQSLVNQQGL